MGKKRRSLNATIGTAANPFKCGKGSECPDKGGECRLWHPHQMQPRPHSHQHPSSHPHSHEMHPPDLNKKTVSSGGSVKEQQLEDVEYEPTMKEKQSHRDFHEEDLECEPTMVALHGLAASIRQGADRESREAFKILIQEYRPKGCSK